MTWGESWGGLWGGGDVGQPDHADDGDERVYEQFKPAANLRALARALNDEVTALEWSAFDVKHYRAISTAAGQTLDDLGEGLDLPRQGLPDDAYRLALSVRVRALFSSGTARDALEVLSALMKNDGRARGLVEAYPASFCVFGVDLTPTEISLLSKILPDVPAAGVSACLITWSTGEVLAYVSDDATIPAAFGFSSVTDPSIVGSGFAHAIAL